MVMRSDKEETVTRQLEGTFFSSTSRPSRQAGSSDACSTVHCSLCDIVGASTCANGDHVPSPSAETEKTNAASCCCARLPDAVVVYRDTYLQKKKCHHFLSESPLALPAGVQSPMLQAVLPTEVSASSTCVPSTVTFATQLSRPSPHVQIVLYRNRRMVVYDPTTHKLRFCVLSSNKEMALRCLRLAQCPMCGQIVDPSKFSFETQGYFRLLQTMWSTRFNFTNSRRRTLDPIAQDESGNSPRGFLSDQYTEACGEQCRETGASNPFVNEELRRKRITSSDAESGAANDHESVLTGMCITGYYASFFNEIRSLGSGSYGQVYLCHHYLDDVYIGEYAVKKVPVGQDRRWLQSMLREVKIREKLHHANVVEYKHSWLEMHRTSPHLPLIPWLFVLMEFCNAGDLDHFLTMNNYAIQEPWAMHNGEMTTDTSTNKPRFTYMKESFIWKLFLDIANGLNHLHHSGILHRDLKPQNILLHCTINRSSNRPETTALLSDFGTSELIADKMHDRDGFTGTVEYTAPELLETDETGQFREDYDERSDVWSLGIVIYVMAFGHVPYFDKDPQRCRTQILKHTDPRLIIPPHAKRSADLILLIEALLQRNPQLRPSLDTILQHPRIKRRSLDMAHMAEIEMELSFILGESWNKVNTTGGASVSTASQETISILDVTSPYGTRVSGETGCIRALSPRSQRLLSP